MSDDGEVQRLKRVLESASNNANLRNKETVQASVDIAKDRTLYFEKLALGSAATIAALVSFLGAHASRLQPAWLLRTALVTLACTMSASMFRNWLYPIYVFSAKLAIEYRAKQDEDRRKYDLVKVVPAIVEEDGQLINMTEWSLQHAKDDATYADLIAEQIKIEDRSWTWTIRLENAALILALSSALLLIVLAWRNF